MGAAREKMQADFDLERFIDMFDEALTSNDTRVKNALRQLMMMVILTDNSHEGRSQRINGRQGPLRRLAEDLQTLNKRLHNLIEEVLIDYNIQVVGDMYFLYPLHLFLESRFPMVGFPNLTILHNRLLICFHLMRILLVVFYSYFNTI